jgi:hypothetical protein
MKIQKRLAPESKVKYSYGPYNKYNKEEQWIRITEGCPHNCPYCYEPQKIKIFNIPEIVRNKVKIMDMNLLCKKEALAIIEELGKRRVDGKVVYYECICGIDYRFLTQEIANALKESRFKNIRIAWDWGKDQMIPIRKALKRLFKAGYKANDIMIFMICNWDIPYSLNLQKLELCKVWDVKVADCYYDNQTAPNIVPIKWTDEQIKDFRKRVRLHNQMINFKIRIDWRNS